MAVVTVARQTGSLGTEIAARAAQELGLRLVDREMIHAAAREAGVPEQALAELAAEHRRGIIEQVLAAMRTLPPVTESARRQADPAPSLPFGASLAPTPSALPISIQDYVHMLEEVVRRLAAEPVVLLGRATQVILRDHPQAVHVLLVAPQEVRVRRVMAAEGLSEPEARQRVRDLDSARSNFLRRHFGARWLDPLLYDVVLNTGRLSKEQAVEVICRLTRDAG